MILEALGLIDIAHWLLVLCDRMPRNFGLGGHEGGRCTGRRENSPLACSPAGNATKPGELSLTTWTHGRKYCLSKAPVMSCVIKRFVHGQPITHNNVTWSRERADADIRIATGLWVYYVFSGVN